MEISTITPTELAKLCEDGRPIDLIDVRTPIEFQELHAVPARNVPLDQLDPAAVMRAHQDGGLSQLVVATKMGLSPSEVPLSRCT